MLHFSEEKACTGAAETAIYVWTDSRVTVQKNQKNIDRRKVQLYKVKKKLIAPEQHWADKLD